MIEAKNVLKIRLQRHPESHLASRGVVGSSLSLRSVWEAKNVIGVVDSAMGRLKCDRGRRFYRAPAHRS